jgi:hypothetical protein
VVLIEFGQRPVGLLETGQILAVDRTIRYPLERDEVSQAGSGDEHTV